MKIAIAYAVILLLAAGAGGMGKLVLDGELVVTGTIAFNINCAAGSEQADEITVSETAIFKVGSKVDITEQNKPAAVAQGRTWNAIRSDRISVRPNGSATSNNADYELTFYENKKFDIKKV